MPRKERDLFDAIAAFPALHAAALRAATGKRAKPGAAAFLANLEKDVLRLERELRSGRYTPGRYRTIEVFDPKHRVVSAAPFRDRAVQHALCAVVEPLFERGFIHDSYANRKGKGTHRAVARYERFRHVLRCDIHRYFPAIDHGLLKRDLRRRIACARTLALADRIIDTSNPQEPVCLYYPGDDLFTPFERRRGLPIGNLTSQLFANLYLDGLDHFCKEVLRAKAPCATWTTSPCFTTTPGGSRTGGAGLRASWKAAACACTRARPVSPGRRSRRSSWASSSCPAAGDACRKRTCAASATACGGCATAGAEAG